MRTIRRISLEPLTNFLMNSTAPYVAFLNRFQHQILQLGNVRTFGEIGATSNLPSDERIWDASSKLRIPQDLQELYLNVDSVSRFALLFLPMNQASRNLE